MIDMLNLPRLKVLEMEDQPDQYTFLAESEAKPFKCDKCNRMRFYAHGVRRQVYMDTPSHGKMVTIVVDRKRFRCQDCGAVTLQPRWRICCGMSVMSGSFTGKFCVI